MKKNSQKGLTKRNNLYLENGVFFGVLIIFLVVFTLFSHGPLSLKRVFIYILIQCAFTLMTLIVYYLSIMADALDRGYKKEEDKESKEDKK